jgi:hypothetical protein
MSTCAAARTPAPRRAMAAHHSLPMRQHVLIAGSPRGRAARRRRLQHLLQLVYVGAAAAHIGPHFLLNSIPLSLS